jgi:hypothetical protein
MSGALMGPECRAVLERFFESMGFPDAMSASKRFVLFAEIGVSFFKIMKSNELGLSSGLSRVHSDNACSTY